MEGHLAKRGAPPSIALFFGIGISINFGVYVTLYKAFTPKFMLQISNADQSQLFSGMNSVSKMIRLRY